MAPFQKQEGSWEKRERSDREKEEQLSMKGRSINL